MKIICIISLCFCFCLKSAFCQNIPQDLSIRTGKLSNGLSYLLKKNSTPKGQADFHLVQRTGSILEEDSQRGFSHFLEHMAFNGTKHFPGNSLVTELEKKGIKFGSNINAYTGYDETVYRLTSIPMSREGMLDTALLILHDWSGFILNQDKDIDEERSVIKEEWRTRSNGYLRVQDTQVIPALLYGTPYANRLPIGSMEVVMNFKYDQLKDYYKKWYRPDFQGIIIVGDIDVDKVEKKIKDLFSDVNLPENLIHRPIFNLNDAKKSIVVVASDAEITNASASVLWRQSPYLSKDRQSLSFFRKRIIDNLISNLINQRFSELKDKTRTWNSLSIMDKYSVANSVPAWSLSMNVSDGSIMNALKADLLEMERIRRYGFTISELDPTIRRFHLINNETDYYDYDQITNSAIADDLIKQYLEGELVPDKSWKYEMTKKTLTELTIDSLNYYVKQYLNASPPSIIVLFPASDSIKPTKKSVLNLLQEVNLSKLAPYVKKVKQNDFINLKSSDTGKIIKMVSATDPFGFTKWVLSNGMKIWFKNSGYRESKVLVFGFKPGGYSQVDPETLPSALAYNQVTNLSSGFEGADGLSVRLLLKPYASQIATSGSFMNLKLIFQNIYLSMMKFKEEPLTFENWKSNQFDRVRNKNVLPKDVFGDTLRLIMSNNHPRAISLQNETILTQVSYEKIKGLHTQFFGSAKDYNFVIVGNLNIDTVKKLVQTWLGSVPALPNDCQKVIDHHIYPPIGVVKRRFVQKMETPQTTITIGYTGKIAHTLENRKLMSLVSDILKKRYFREIREKEGGTYGVQVMGELFDQPTERYIFQINFDTAPDSVKTKHLLNIIYQEINKLKRLGPDEEEYKGALEADLKVEEENDSKKNAEYWYNKQGVLLQYGDAFALDMKTVLLGIDKKKIKDFCKSIFGQGNLIEVIMEPK